MTKNQIHEWHDRNDEGKRVYYRGYWNSREWTLRYQDSETGDWLIIENPTIELWIALRDVLWRKYQRKRIPHKFIVSVDEILEKLGYKPEVLEAEEEEY
jgi:hypothetical protein